MNGNGADSPTPIYITIQTNLALLFKQKAFVRETILSCLSLPQMGWNIEIKKAKKSRDTATLKPNKRTKITEIPEKGSGKEGKIPKYDRNMWNW